MKTVIFACIHNAGRSQMAAAWFNQLADARQARAISAGTEPARCVHPVVLEAMREIGVDLADEKPKKLTDELARTAQMLVTMGCGEQCPIVPGLRREDWPLEDPNGKPMEKVREIRDDVRARVVALVRREKWEKPMVRAAQPNDRAGALSLLVEAGLPMDGVEEHFASFLVVDDGGKIVGVAGLELYGNNALLRSVAVAAGAKGTGVGTLLTHRALEEASRRGAAAVYLLTTTAEAFFPRFGFERTAREEVPESVRGSREFQGACPASATVMRRVL
jgi:arsenate reductase